MKFSYLFLIIFPTLFLFASTLPEFGPGEKYTRVPHTRLMFEDKDPSPSQYDEEERELPEMREFKPDENESQNRHRKKKATAPFIISLSSIGFLSDPPKLQRLESNNNNPRLQNREHLLSYSPKHSPPVKN